MTVLILSIISAVALPKLFNFQVYQQRAFYDDALNAFRYAQKLAIASSCNVQVAVASNQFTLKLPTNRGLCTSTSGSSFTRDVPRPNTGETVYSGSLAGMTMTSATVYFTARGNAVANATIAVGSGQINVVQETGFVYGSPP